MARSSAAPRGGKHDQQGVSAGVCQRPTRIGNGFCCRGWPVGLNALPHPYHVRRSDLNLQSRKNVPPDDTAIGRKGELPGVKHCREDGGDTAVHHIYIRSCVPVSPEALIFEGW